MATNAFASDGQQQEYVEWHGRIKAVWSPTSAAPPTELVTSVHSLCFYQGKIMLVQLTHRGWDIPGGHREQGESVEESIQRESLEEGYVRGTHKLIGVIKVDHSENPEWSPAGKYPLVGYQLFYRTDITDVLPFAGEYESAGRIFVDVSELPSRHHRWNRMLDLLLEAAVRAEPGPL